MDGLRAGEFTLSDNGRPQRIEVDYSETLAPISLVVAVQTSDIAAPVIAKFTKAGSLIQPLITGQGGEAALVTFDDEVRVAQDFTSDPSAIADAFRAVKAGGSRAGHTIDALTESIRMLAARPGNRRRVVVIVCESRDRGSRADLWETLDSAQRAGIAVYPATFSAQKSAWTVKAGELPPTAGGGLIPVFVELSRLGKKNAADAMSLATGGEHLSFSTLRGFERLIAGVGEELHSQYLLSFTQPASDGAYHEVQVQIPNHPEFVVRCRPGYWANSAGATIN